MRTPRTLFVEPYGQIGGSERYLETLLSRLPADAIAGVVCLQHGAFPTLLRESGYNVAVADVGPSALDIARAAGHIRRAVRRHRPEVVHANGLKAALACGLAAVGTKVPTVWVKHDFSWDGPIARLGAALSSRVISVSDAAAGVFSDGVRRRKVRTVHNGIDAAPVDRDRARDLLRAALGVPPGTPVVSLVGRLHPVKGHVDLLAVTAQLRQSVADARVAFIGGDDPSQPEFAASIRQRCTELGLDGAVTFLGFRTDVADLVAGSDVVAVTSGVDERGFGREAFPLAALEALALGTPVVAYADGGVPELVGDCGLLVPPRDREALAAALVRALTDQEWAAAVRARGLRRIAAEFTVDRMVERTVAVYREAVDS